jgi:hypothetical protein
VNVSTEADLGKLRRYASRLEHDDERLRDAVVTLRRSGATVGRIDCATSDLAWTAYRICAGIRYRSEFAADEAQPMALAA